MVNNIEGPPNWKIKKKYFIKRKRDHYEEQNF